MWLPGVPCSHQNDERMSISSQFQVLSCHFRSRTVVFGGVPPFRQKDVPSVSCPPLASSTAQSCSPSSPVCLCPLATHSCLCLLFSFFLIIFLKMPLLPGECMPLFFLVVSEWHRERWKNTLFLRVSGSGETVIAYVLSL